MQCKFGHDHSASPVRGATRNPAPRGKRPYHCPKCDKADSLRPHHYEPFWETYDNAAAAVIGIEIDGRMVGHPERCRFCF